jgi:hypothetical protein
MRSWFGRRLVTDPATAATVPADGIEAYREGRADERQRLQRDGLQVDRATSDAYDRGRRDERLRHRGSPLLALITIILVVIAVGILFLAAKTGSFSNAGAVIDNMIQNPVHAAADKAGSALENAGQSLKSSAPPPATNQGG